jgi:hypothetical protein
MSYTATGQLHNSVYPGMTYCINAQTNATDGGAWLEAALIRRSVSVLQYGSSPLGIVKN